MSSFAPVHPCLSNTWKEASAACKAGLRVKHTTKSFLSQCPSLPAPLLSQYFHSTVIRRSQRVFTFTCLKKEDDGAYFKWSKLAFSWYCWHSSEPAPGKTCTKVFYQAALSEVSSLYIVTAILKRDYKPTRKQKAGIYFPSCNILK